MISSLFWKLLERFGVKGVQFILQIILARILSPDHYGTLALMIIFVNLATVFIQNGFSMALVQNKDVTEEDYSSVFWISLLMSVCVYLVLFFTAPLIAGFYKMPEIIGPFRTLTLMLIPGSVNSIQVAKISREMDFKKNFTSNISAIVISGVVGVIIACLGGGLWALVVQNILNTVIICIVMLITVKWRPVFACNLKRVRILFSFGWKLLVSSLLDTLYIDLSNLIVGKKYSKSTLAYFNRGNQFPQFLITAINGAVQSVMLPVMAKEQDDIVEVKKIMRNSITMSAYVIFPIMAGLAAVATPLVQILLTDKWLPCVPYLQIFCFTYAFWPVHTCNLQTINALGRSDVFLKLEIIKKAYGVSSLLIAVVLFDSPLAIAVANAISTIVSSFINAYPNKKLIGYSYFDQMKDILPSFLISIIMFLVVYLVGLISLNNMLILLLQVFTGISVYLILSVLFKLAPFAFLKNNIVNMIKK